MEPWTGPLSPTLNDLVSVIFLALVGIGLLMMIYGLLTGGSKSEEDEQEEDQ